MRIGRRIDSTGPLFAIRLAGRRTFMTTKEPVPAAPPHGRRRSGSANRANAGRQEPGQCRAQRDERPNRAGAGRGAPNMALMAARSRRSRSPCRVRRGVLLGRRQPRRPAVARAKAAIPPLRCAASRTMSVCDAIYQQFPVNYKVFQKPGTLADLGRQRDGGPIPFFKLNATQYEQSGPLPFLAPGDWDACCGPRQWCERGPCREAGA